MSNVATAAPPRLDVNAKQKVEYCIPLWLRDEQIKAATARIKLRISAGTVTSDPIALVCYGPSLNDTWEQIKDFKYVMSCSGAHKFLVERGIIPTWHVEVDPRAHKTLLIGTPQQETEYLIASTCHAAVFNLLEGHNVKLWHVFDGAEDALRTLPPNEWALTGGASVGLRTMTIARFLGFTNQHIFGMDGCAGASGKHAAAHPAQPKHHYIVEFPENSGQMWETTPSMLEVARGTWHELNQMPDVRATFYGHGLVQAMADHYVPKPVGKGKALIGYSKPELISSDYQRLNERLHVDNLAYGVGGGRHAPMVLKLVEQLKTQSVLDYGCGKGYLAKAIPFPIWEYDPAIPGKTEQPRAADLVVCTDVLEHIEPELIRNVLFDLKRCVKQVGFFVIHTGPAQKTLADGRNAHLLQRDKKWWQKKLQAYFKIGQIIDKSPELYVVVGPMKGSHGNS